MDMDDRIELHRSGITSDPGAAAADHRRRFSGRSTCDRARGLGFADAAAGLPPAPRRHHAGTWDGYQEMAYHEGYRSTPEGEALWQADAAQRRAALKACWGC